MASARSGAKSGADLCQQLEEERRFDEQAIALLLNLHQAKDDLIAAQAAVIASYAASASTPSPSLANLEMAVEFARDNAMQAAALIAGGVQDGTGGAASSSGSAAHGIARMAGFASSSVAVFAGEGWNEHWALTSAEISSSDGAKAARLLSIIQSCTDDSSGAGGLTPPPVPAGASDSAGCWRSLVWFASLPRSQCFLLNLADSSRVRGVDFLRGGAMQTARRIVAAMPAVPTLPGLREDCLQIGKVTGIRRLSAAQQARVHPDATMSAPDAHHNNVHVHQHVDTLLNGAIFPFPVSLEQPAAGQLQGPPLFSYLFAQNAASDERVPVIDVIFPIVLLGLTLLMLGFAHWALLLFKRGFRIPNAAGGYDFLDVRYDFVSVSVVKVYPGSPRVRDGLYVDRRRPCRSTRIPALTEGSGRWLGFRISARSAWSFSWSAPCVRSQAVRLSSRLIRTR